MYYVSIKITTTHDEAHTHIPKDVTTQKIDTFYMQIYIYICLCYLEFRFTAFL
jgi:hypothetical protein